MAKVKKREWKTAAGEIREAWVADYFDQQRKRHLKTFKRKKDAEAWLAQAVVDIKDGVHTAERSSITVSEACELWLKRGAREGLERGTLRNYADHCKRINHHLGSVKLAKLTEPVIHHFRDRLLDEGLSRKTASIFLTSLKGVLKEAKTKGLVAQNVALGVTLPKRTRDERQLEEDREFPSKEDVRRILATVEGRWRPLIVTAVFTGMRASELRGLMWRDVDFDRKTVSVRQRANFWRELGMPKSRAGQRTIPMSPMVVNVLREWKLACPRGELGVVFPNGAGKVETHSNLVNRGWHVTQIAAGVVGADGKAKYGFHALRHFAASLFIEQGFSPKRLQALLGHSSIQMTFDRYGHLFPSLEDDFTKLAAGELSVVGG